MKRGKTIDSLSSISSNDSESDSDGNSSNDSESEVEKQNNKRRSSQENQRKEKKKKHRKHKRNNSRQQENQEQPRQIKRQGTLRISDSRKPTINITKADNEPQKKRSNSIDSPQRVNIRSKNKQNTLLNPNLIYNNVLRVNEAGNQLTFNKQSDGVNQMSSRRMQKSKTYNEMDQPRMFQFNGGSQANSKAEFLHDNEDDDYNIQNNQSNRFANQQTTQNKLRLSQVEANLSSNESSNSLYQQTRKRSSAQLLPSQIYDGGVQLLSLDNGDADQLKFENQQLQNKLVQQKNKQNELQKINNDLMKENDQQNKLISNINNKLDLNQNNVLNLIDSNIHRSPVNDFDKKINHLNKLSKNQDEKRKNGCVQRIINYLLKINPFNGHIKRINNTLGSEVIPYFGFILYLILLHLLMGIIYIYFYIDYFVHSEYNSKYQNFVSYLISHNYENNTQVSYATTFILMVALQVLLTLMLYSIQTRDEVIYKAQFNKHLKTFRLVFNSWSMNIHELNYVERMKMSLVKRIKTFLKIKRVSSGEENMFASMDGDNKDDVSLIQKLIVVITLFALNIGFIVSGLILTSLIINSQPFNSQYIIFFDQLLKSTTISLIAYVISYFLKILSECEFWIYHTKYIHIIKYSKMLLGHLSIITLFLFLNLSQLKYQEEKFSFLMIETVTFNSSIFNCPEEQFAYSLLSLFLGYAAACIIINYISTLKNILLNFICSSSKQLSAIERSFYNITEFSPLDNVIPLIILNALSICLAPFFPFIFTISSCVLFGVYLHNYKYIIHFKMPSFETADSYQIKNIIIQFYTVCNFLTFVFLGVIMSLGYQRRLFTSNESQPQRTCGAYNTEETPLKSFQQFLEQNSFIGNVYEIINFRPLLWALFLFFLFSYIMKNSTQQEWKNQYKQKFNELHLIKSHFQDKVFGLQDRITQVKSNINYQSPKNYTPSTNRSTPQKDKQTVNSNGKNSPAQSSTVLQLNQNGSTQLISNNSLNAQSKDNNNNNNVKPSLFSRTQKSTGTYVGIGNLSNTPDNFSKVLNKF